MGMKKYSTGLRVTAAVAASLWLSAATFAQDPPTQQPGQEQPKPAGKAYGPIGAPDQDPNQNPDLLQPDNRPLTGFLEPTLGTPIERHSYWVPGVAYYNYIQSNGQTQGGGDGWSSTSYVSGNLSLLQQWSRSSLSLNLSGGGEFSTDSSIGNGYFQQVGATQTFNWERLQLTLVDQFSYLPQSQFGFGAGTGLGVPGIGGSLGGSTPGIGNGYSPGQSIFTAIGPQYSNTFGTQINYTLTPRSSVTVGGLFSILRFIDPGNVESNDYIGNVGYNHQISRADTIGLVYRYSSYHYIGVNQAIGDQMIQVAYGRKITGRIALQISGGPEITTFRVPQPPSTKTQYIGGAGSASLSYALENGGLSLSYSHGITAGSGVLVGATTDQVTGSISKRISRLWTGELHLGYARNANPQTGTGLPTQNFNSIFTGGSLARPLGRNANFSLGYTAYIETSNNTGNNSLSTQQITLGVSWHTRPFVLH
jgi:hypothetical protein